VLRSKLLPIQLPVNVRCHAQFACLGSQRQLKSFGVPHERLIGDGKETRHGGGGLSGLLLQFLLDQQCPHVYEAALNSNCWCRSNSPSL
jgi:hypothetical protein